MNQALIAFLGTSRYQPVVYRVGARTASERRLSFASLHELFPAYQPVVLATREAIKANGGLVDKELAGHYELVTIPTGKNEEEVWRILKKLVQKLGKYDKLILDITHGFRAQPLLAFGALLLVRSSGRAEVEHVFYGAYEQKDKDGVAPFFDLRPLVDFVDWAEALATLNRHGHAERVVELIRKENSAAWRSQGGRGPRHLQSLSSALQDVSRALMINRPCEALDHSLKLRELLPEAKRELKQVPSLAPVADLLSSSTRDFLAFCKRISKDSGKKACQDRRVLGSLASMIRYLLKVGAYAQAITLAREAIVTKLCLDKGLDPERKDARKTAEHLLGAWQHMMQAKASLSQSQKTYADLWDRVADLRNDVNHAGFRENAGKASRVASKIEKYCQEVAGWLTR